MFLTREQVRGVDRRAIEEFGIPGAVLMENAGRGAAEILVSLGIHGPVIVCCGKGNNGGDGFVIARHLHNRGVHVRVLLFGRAEDLKGDAALNYQIACRAGILIDVHPETTVNVAALRGQLAPAEWVVDALFGTGLTGPLQSPFAEVIEAINSSPVRVLAVDIPSGLDCDSGEPLGPTVRAHHTITFVANKQGFARPAAQPWIGLVHVVGIGAPRACLPSS